jgi:hypothetical protein
MLASSNRVSQKKSWGTPQKFIDPVKEMFGGSISLDPCSNEFSIVNAEVEYLLPEKDGLKESWNFPTIFVNPPYGLIKKHYNNSSRKHHTSIKDWIIRCASAYREHGSEVIALIPVATSTSHWKQYIFGVANSVCFLSDYRVMFLENGKTGGKGSPMACCLVYYGNREDRFKEIFKGFGAVVPVKNA